MPFASRCLLPLSVCAALAMAACIDAPGADGASGAIEAPLPEGAPRVLTADDDGRAVEAAVGDTIAVTLVGVPTAGYLWETESVPGFLSRSDDLSGPTSEAQRQPGFTGGSHWEVLVFRVDGPGEGQLALVQRRPWETDEPPADTFTVDIRAR